jgi:hypothetical protein
MPLPSLQCPFSNFPCDTRIATGTPGSHLHHARELLAQSTRLGQTWLLRSDVSPQVSVATASGNTPMPQLQPYRSHSHRGLDRVTCRYGQNRTLTNYPNSACLSLGVQSTSVCPAFPAVSLGALSYISLSGFAVDTSRYINSLCKASIISSASSEVFTPLPGIASKDQRSARICAVFSTFITHIARR